MHTSSTALWYASRATGVVCLLLMTAVILFGLLISRQRRLPGLPRFGVIQLHRYLSLLTVCFVAVHVLTAVADSYVSISPAAAVIPFVSSYQPLWLGLGAVSVDLMLAVVATSLVRPRIGRKTWRAVHWLAYASWPIAVVHGIGTGPDLRSGLLLGLTIGCVLAVCAAIAWRVAVAMRVTPLRQRVPALVAAHEPAAAASSLASR